jgi:hypothetical protein
VAAPAIDNPRHRSRFLSDLVSGQDVALAHDSLAPLDKGRIVAEVYRVSDGLFVNLKMVQEGYGVPAENAPEALQAALLAAELEARAGQRGLWSPAAQVEEAALEQQKNQQHEIRDKGLKTNRGKKDPETEALRNLRNWMDAADKQSAMQTLQLSALYAQTRGLDLAGGEGALRNWMDAVEAADEQTAMQAIALWERRYTPSSPGSIRQAHLADLARQEAERKRQEEEERRRAPEIDAGPAAVAVALLVAGMLMLADRRRLGAA